ncbi:zinc finger protein 541-like isoform X1 [Mugil cephalus]|uniref:zinc finger protein 541-like isoform X1 n=1 Tax=Mugil cephalus TaxID=48193 RepID=UPI001FB7E7F6|nr:zinc finger protein 541-like isoform X1 [Mugil cephalus]
MSACCVVGCKSRHSTGSSLKFYRIPSGSRPFQANRRRLWLQVIQQANGSTEKLKLHARICGAHFISGEASMDHDNPDFVPSVFTRVKESPKKKRKWFYGCRKSRRRTVNAAEQTTPPRSDSPDDLPSSLLKENEIEHSEEMQTPPRPSLPEEGKIILSDEVEPLSEEADKTTNQTKLLPSEPPAGLSELGKMNPVVLLKSVIAHTGGYLCEVCNQIFATVSQLLKHRQLHEDLTCDICGKCFTSHADFTKHHCPHEPSFPCNMCDRSFATIHRLKRHKLLHVKDGRKCIWCGMLFCQRHKHILYLPQAEANAKSEDESFIAEPQLNELEPSELEQSIVMEMLDNSQSSETVTPQMTSSLPTVKPTSPVLGVLSNNSKMPPPASHTRISSEFPVLMPTETSLMPCPPSPKLRYSRKPGTIFQLKPVPDYPANFVQPHLPQHPQLPSSLTIFSPQVLTSALLEVKRNYEYILKRQNSVRPSVKIVNTVKEEPCEPLMISPNKDRVKQEESGRIAYDLEIEIEAEDQSCTSATV